MKDSCLISIKRELCSCREYCDSALQDGRANEIEGKSLFAQRDEDESGTLSLGRNRENYAFKIRE